MPVTVLMYPYFVSALVLTRLCHVFCQFYCLQLCTAAIAAVQQSLTNVVLSSEHRTPKVRGNYKGDKVMGFVMGALERPNGGPSSNGAADEQEQEQLAAALAVAATAQAAS